MSRTTGPASAVRLREALPSLADAALDAALEAIPGAAVLVDPKGGVVVRANARARSKEAEEGPAFGQAIVTALAEARPGAPTAGRWERTVVRSSAGTHVLLVDPRAGDELDMRLARHGRAWRLTPRCREVLALVVRGEPNRAIAGALGLAERTVEVHLTTIFARAGVASRAALIAAFWEARRAS